MRQVVDVLTSLCSTQDEGLPAPEGVQKVRDAVMAADGVWLLPRSTTTASPAPEPIVRHFRLREESETAYRWQGCHCKVASAAGNKTAGPLAVVKQQFGPAH